MLEVIIRRPFPPFFLPNPLEVRVGAGQSNAKEKLPLLW